MQYLILILRKGKYIFLIILQMVSFWLRWYLVFGGATYFLEEKLMIQNSYTFSETLSVNKGNEQSFFSQDIEELKEKKRWNKAY